MMAFSKAARRVDLLVDGAVAKWAALLGNSLVAWSDVETAVLKVVEKEDEMVVSKVAWMVV